MGSMTMMSPTVRATLVLAVGGGGGRGILSMTLREGIFVNAGVGGMDMGWLV